jgi:hypothetical protein
MTTKIAGTLFWTVHWLQKTNLNKGVSIIQMYLLHSMIHTQNQLFPWNFWCQNMISVHTQCDAEKNKCHLKLSTNNMQSKGQPFKSWVFCRAHWALNSSVKGWMKCAPVCSITCLFPCVLSSLCSLYNSTFTWLKLWRNVHLYYSTNIRQPFHFVEY